MISALSHNSSYSHIHSKHVLHLFAHLALTIAHFTQNSTFEHTELYTYMYNVTHNLEIASFAVGPVLAHA